MKLQDRDYAAISSTARDLLLLKAQTPIPFAKEAAQLLLPDVHQPLPVDSIAYWKRRIHFESRYWQVDQLLEQQEASNILELSSGFSFRGLDMTYRKNVDYADTDLEEVIRLKSALLPSLTSSGALPKGRLQLEVLNALDMETFSLIVDRLPAGALTIVNEGLLMYLGLEEKRKLCAIIRTQLQKRGGCWITADIYRRVTLERVGPEGTDTLKEVVDQQHIEDNMFPSFQDATSFFEGEGFSIAAEANLDYKKISSLAGLLQLVNGEQLAIMGSEPPVQKTWCLRVG